MELEELTDEDVEIETKTQFNLYWKCKNCNEDNIQFDIPIDGKVECSCWNCDKEYIYYHCIY